MNIKQIKSTTVIAYLMVIAFFLSGCGVGDGETTLNVRFDSHPRGGSEISSLSSIITVTRNYNDKSNILQSKGSPDDITITVEWWWMAGDKSDNERMSQRRETIRSSSQTYEASISASPGHILMNYWFLRVSWEDDNGYHERESRTVFLSAQKISPLQKGGPVTFYFSELE